MKHSVNNTDIVSWPQSGAADKDHPNTGGRENRIATKGSVLYSEGCHRIFDSEYEKKKWPAKYE